MRRVAECQGAPKSVGKMWVCEKPVSMTRAASAGRVGGGAAGVEAKRAGMSFHGITDGAVDGECVREYVGGVCYLRSASTS